MKKLYSIQYDPKLKPDLNVDCDDDALFMFRNSLGGDAKFRYEKKWHPPSFYHLNNNPAKTTFFGGMHFLCFAFYESLLHDQSLINILKSSGEILPAACSDSDKIVYQYHCTNCIGSQRDFFKSERMAVYATVYRNEIEFSEAQIPQRGLFWLSPNERFLYTVENQELGIEHNFKMLYDARGYSGLDFVEAKLI